MNLRRSTNKPNSHWNLNCANKIPFGGLLKSREWFVASRPSCIGVRPCFDSPGVVACSENHGIDAVHDAFVVRRASEWICLSEEIGLYYAVDDLLTTNGLFRPLCTSPCEAV